MIVYIWSWEPFTERCFFFFSGFFQISQVVIVPCGINVNVTEEEKKQLIVACESFEKKLTAAGVRVKGLFLLPDYLQLDLKQWNVD